MSKPFDFDSFMLGCIAGAIILAALAGGLHYISPSLTPLDLGIPI